MFWSAILRFNCLFWIKNKQHLDTNGDKKVDTLDEIRGLIFTNVMAPLGAIKKPYEEITELPKLTDACEESLQQYNMVSDKPMDLVLF